MVTSEQVHTAEPILLSEKLSKTFVAPRRRLFQPHLRVEAVRDVSLSVREGESLAIVGESGSGKSTLLRLLMGLDTPTSGRASWRGRTITAKQSDRLLWLRRECGIVFQDPYSSLNPRWRVADIVAEPLKALAIRGDHHQLVLEMLERVGLPKDSMHRYPHEFSGGQRQRIALSRALIHRPTLLVGDEPVSALDVLVRRNIISLISEFRQEMRLTLLTVTHDFSLVKSTADRVAVMRAGEIVELGNTKDIVTHPAHPYTQQLIDAIPRLPS